MFPKLRLTFRGGVYATIRPAVHLSPVRCICAVDRETGEKTKLSGHTVIAPVRV